MESIMDFNGGITLSSVNPNDQNINWDWEEF